MIKKKSCGISRGLGFMGLEFQRRRGVTQSNFAAMWSFWGVKPCFVWDIARGKVKNLKIPGIFQKSMSSTPLFLLWNSPLFECLIIFVGLR